MKPIRLNRTKIFSSFSVSESLRFNSTDWGGKRGAPREKRRVRGTANGITEERLYYRKAGGTARGKEESGQQDIKKKRRTGEG